MNTLKEYFDTAVLTTRTRWSEVPRIRHQIARVLAQQLRVVFVETPIEWRRWNDTEFEAVEENIFRLRPANRWNLPLRVKAHFPPADRLWQRAPNREIKACLHQIGADLDRTLLMNFNHTEIDLMAARIFRTSVYVCNDDWVAKAPNPWRRRTARRLEQAVASRADLCLAVSYPLLERLSEYNANTRLLLPAHDFDLEGAGDKPRSRGAGTIKAAFMGELNGRLAYDWVLAAARAQGIEFHMVGPVVLRASRVQELLDAGVHLHGAKLGAELQSFLESMDVLVMPYLVEKGVVAATAPNKLFKYIAAGAPIVISDMPHFMELGPRVIYRARTAGEFVQQIRAAAAEDDAPARALRREIAEENSWDRRGVQLCSMLTETAVRQSSESPRLSMTDATRWW